MTLNDTKMLQTEIKTETKHLRPRLRPKMLVLRLKQHFWPRIRSKIFLPEVKKRRSRARPVLQGRGHETLTSLFISVCTCNLQLNNAPEKGKLRHVEGHGLLGLPPYVDLCVTSYMLGRQKWISVICPIWHTAHSWTGELTETPRGEPWRRDLLGANSLLTDPDDVHRTVTLKLPWKHTRAKLATNVSR